jgi:uncharacterized DUF497 family protein
VEFEWDEAKQIGNLRKHGVDFAAVRQFDWAEVQESEDRRKNYGERRWVAYGRIGDRLHVLIYTRRGERVRVISLRRANNKETDEYERQN